MSKTHKKFYNINRWEQRFFMNLTPAQKLAWEYVNDRSDNIGVWEPNLRALQFHIGADIDVDDFFNAVNDGEERLIILDSGDWLIPHYVKFQYCQSKPLSPRSPSHRSYLKDMEDRGLLLWFCKYHPDVMATCLDYKNELDGKQLDGLEKSFKSFLDTLIKRSKRGLEELSKSNKDKDNANDTNTATEIDPAADPEKANTGIRANSSLKASNDSQKKESDLESAGSISDSANDVGEPSVDNLLDPKPNLYYHKLAKQLKEIIPEDVLDGVSSDEMEKDLEAYHDTLESEGKDNPRAYIIGRAKSLNWTGMRWPDFEGELFETKTPF